MERLRIMQDTREKDVGWGQVRGQVGEEILFGGVIFLDVNAGCEE
jgi:hypothetical protein